jgi:hypothetical protein
LGKGWVAVVLSVGEHVDSSMVHRLYDASLFKSPVAPVDTDKAISVLLDRGPG